MEPDFNAQFAAVVDQYQNKNLSLTEAKEKLADLLRRRSYQSDRAAIAFDVSSLSKLDPEINSLLLETLGESHLLLYDHASILPELTTNARRVIAGATRQAILTGLATITMEHLLIALIETDGALLSRFLSEDSVEMIREQIEAQQAQGFSNVTPSSDEPLLSKECRMVLTDAEEEARLSSHESIDAVHLLMGLLRQTNGLVPSILRDHGLNVSAIREQLG